jgi:hypothetical protein
MATGQPEGEGPMLDVAHLEALLAKTFNIGIDCGRGKEPVALVRLRLSKALLGAAEAQALMAESVAQERGVTTENIAEAEGFALHAGAFNGIPDRVFHLTARAMGIVAGLAMTEPDPRASGRDLILDAALRAATGLGELLRFRRECYTATSPAEQAGATAKLTVAGAELALAAKAVIDLLELARMTDAAGRTGKQDLN